MDRDKKVEIGKAESRNADILKKDNKTAGQRTLLKRPKAEG
jgi:hypothetical protein